MWAAITNCLAGFSAVHLEVGDQGKSSCRLGVSAVWSGLEPGQVSGGEIRRGTSFSSTGACWRMRADYPSSCLPLVMWHNKWPKREKEAALIPGQVAPSPWTLSDLVPATEVVYISIAAHGLWVAFELHDIRHDPASSSAVWGSWTPLQLSSCMPQSYTE